MEYCDSHFLVLLLSLLQVNNPIHFQGILSGISDNSPREVRVDHHILKGIVHIALSEFEYLC